MKIALVLGSGGHTSELLKIITNLPASIADTAKHLLIYSEGDTLSLDKYKLAVTSDSDEAPAVIRRVTRARMVGQSYFTSIITTIYSFIMSIFILFQFRPKIVRIKWFNY